jgi:hypothetical protein
MFEANWSTGDTFPPTGQNFVIFKLSLDNLHAIYSTHDTCMCVTIKYGKNSLCTEGLFLFELAPGSMLSVSHLFNKHLG